MSDFTNEDGLAVAALVTKNRTIVTSSDVLRWTAQGKVFAAGHGLQSDPIDSQGETTLVPDDVKATVGLQAPAGSKFIVPILLRLCFEVEGGAATDSQLIFTKSASECATTLSLSGRDMIMPSFPLLATSPVQNAATASALYGVATSFLLTVSELTAADMVMYDYTAMADNNVVAPLVGASNKAEFDFLNTGAPHIMTNQAAMLFYISSGTSDSKFHPYIQWAELDLNDLV